MVPWARGTSRFSQFVWAGHGDGLQGEKACSFLQHNFVCRTRDIHSSEISFHLWLCQRLYLFEQRNGHCVPPATSEIAVPIPRFGSANFWQTPSSSGQSFYLTMERTGIRGDRGGEAYFLPCVVVSWRIVRDSLTISRSRLAQYWRSFDTGGCVLCLRWDKS